MCASRAEPVCISNGRRDGDKDREWSVGMRSAFRRPFLAFVTHGFVPFLILRLNKNSPKGTRAKVFYVAPDRFTLVHAQRGET